MGLKSGPRKPPPANAPSLPWSALSPSSAATGYPRAFQCWDAKQKRWRFIYTGAGSFPPTIAMVRRQLKGSAYAAGWYRFAWVSNWEGAARAWLPIISHRRCSPAVWHSGVRKQ